MTFVAFDKDCTKKVKKIIRDALNGRKYNLIEASWTRGTKEILKDDHNIETVPDGTWTLYFKVGEKMPKEKKTKTFEVYYDKHIHGHVQVEAESKQAAEKKVEQAEFSGEDEYDDGIEVYSVDEVK